MVLRLPSLETERLVIRDFVDSDLADVHRILDQEIDPEAALTLDARRDWLRWTILSYRHLAQLHQPPYGDRAVTTKDDGALIGVVGYSPMLHPLADLVDGIAGDQPHWQPELGLYWALSPSHRGRGYATEAARALMDHAFAVLNLRHIVANTEWANHASQAVMQRLGMTLHHNDAGEPEWFEVLGVLAHPPPS